MATKTKKNGTKSNGKRTKATTKPARAPASDAGARKRDGTGKKAKRVSLLDAAAAVLKEKGEPMNVKAMVEAVFARKLWHSDAPTPWATLYSAILREIQTKGGDGRFKKTDRGHFAFNG